jgi:hypothetical protein
LVPRSSSRIFLFVLLPKANAKAIVSIRVIVKLVVVVWGFYWVLKA